MKIYTRQGDKGNTTLFNGECVPKDHPAIEALGAVDECNSAIGSCVSHLRNNEQFDSVKKQLIHVQHALFDIGAALATPRTRASKTKINRTRFDHDATDELEKWIDTINEKLPEIHTFILPGGHPASALLHLARSICRRAERLILPLNYHAEVSDHILKYMNRLSDYLFMQARHINFLAGEKDTFWLHNHKAED